MTAAATICLVMVVNLCLLDRKRADVTLAVQFVLSLDDKLQHNPVCIYVEITPVAFNRSSLEVYGGL